MINWISSWAKGIVAAVIIGTIIEMILPEGNNKKYIKTVIGIYILFAIVVPVINKFTKEPFELDISKYEKYFNTSSNIKNSQEKLNLNIENTYKQKLVEDITKKITEKNYEVIKMEIDIEYEDENKYGNINKMSLNVKKNEQENQLIKKIETVEISSKKIEEQLKETIGVEERTELKKYLSEQYEISEENIIIF